MNSANDDAAQRATDVASMHFSCGYNCAQSVVLACSEVMGLESNPMIVNSCAGLGGGLGFSGCACGALLGGVLVIGAKHGSEVPGRKNKKAHRLTEELYRRFKQEFSTPCCRSLRKGIDFKDKRLHEHCRRITAGTAGMVVELLEE